MSIVFDLERTNQLSLLPDKDLVDLCPPIEPYQVTKNQIILRRLPDWIQDALIARATEIDYPVEAILEMAIAIFLDTEALSFADCKPGRGR